MSTCVTNAKLLITSFEINNNNKSNFLSASESATTPNSLTSSESSSVCKSKYFPPIEFTAEEQKEIDDLIKLSSDDLIKLSSDDLIKYPPFIFSNNTSSSERNDDNNSSKKRKREESDSQISNESPNTKKLKKAIEASEERKRKNRASAARSRQRQNDNIANLTNENLDLKNENLALKNINFEFENQIKNLKIQNKILNDCNSKLRSQLNTNNTNNF